MKTDYDEIKSYADYMFSRNLKQYNGIMSALDLLSATYAKGFDSIDEAKKIIRNEVLNEKRRLIGRIQQRHIFSMAGYEKRCNKCKELLPAGAFKLIVEKSTGYTYYSSNCAECETIRVTSDEYKRKRREAYANSVVAKEQNRDRQRKWAANQRKVKELKAA